MSPIWKIKVLLCLPPPEREIYLNIYFLVYVVLPSLLPLVTTSDPSLRHGALYAVAELTHALSEHAQSISQTLVQFLGQDIIAELVNIAPRVSRAVNLESDEIMKIQNCDLFIADIGRSVQGSYWRDYETHRWINKQLYT